MNDLTYVSEELNNLKNQLLKRDIKIVKTAGGPWVELEDGKRVLQLSSNNYLGLLNHPEIINASKAAVSKYGAGSSGSRLLSGTTELHKHLELALAEFEGYESAIFFSSGYSANLGVISALINKDDIVYSDELNHASIIDGIRLSGCNKAIYKHRDIEDLEKSIIENKDKYKRSFIITDSVFSMDGDVAPLNEIRLIAEKYNCITLVDEAHATGIFGGKNSGLIEELKLTDFFPVKTGTCSKALGVEGGFCVGSKEVIDFLQNKARSFMFSTSPSPAIIGAVIKSLELIKDSSWRKEKLWQNASFLHKGLKLNNKLRLNEFMTPIVSVYFDLIETCLLFSERLFNECHIWAPVIRPPSVSKPLIRLTPIATHSEDDMKYVIKAFDYLSKELKSQPLPPVVTRS